MAHPNPAAAARPEAPPSVPRCNTLLPFDSDGDGSVSAADRHWRHLYLWVDDNGDGELADDEIEHLFDHGIRAVTVDLDRYTDRRGLSGDVDVEGGAIRFRLSTSRRDVEAILAVDASGLGRSGELELVDANGALLTGFQAFAAGQRLRRDGELLILDCP